MKKPTAILAADIHLDEESPECWLGDYLKEQQECVDFINNLREEHDDIPVIVAGDVFDFWKPSPDLLRWSIENVFDMIAVPGQHDLPQHNLELHPKSGLAVLQAAGIAKVLLDPNKPHMIIANTNVVDIYGFPYGVDLKPIRLKPNSLSIAVIHKMVFNNKAPFPGAKGLAKNIIKKLPGFDLILSGDNHIPFTTTYKGQLLVNPGSMMRRTAAQLNHKPRVYLWYAAANKVEPVYLPAKKGMISRGHIEKKEKREERKQVYISKIKGAFEIGLSFEKNMEAFFAKNKTDRRTKQIINIAMGK